MLKNQPKTDGQNQAAPKGGGKKKMNAPVTKKVAVIPTPKAKGKKKQK